MTFQVMDRGEDLGGVCLRLNLPMHGSIRVEEVVGYNAPNPGDSRYLGGASMGPIILDGLRIKRLMLEFPGRGEVYTVHENMRESLTLEPVVHGFTYRAGEVPQSQWASVPEHVKAVQSDYNPMGRGTEWVLAQLVNQKNSSPNGSGWDQYCTKLRRIEGGKVRSYDFFQLRQHYPPRLDYFD